MHMAFSNQTAQFLLAAMESEEIQQVTSQFSDDEAEVTETRILCWNYWWFLYCTWAASFGGLVSRRGVASNGFTVSIQQLIGPVFFSFYELQAKPTAGSETSPSMRSFSFCIHRWDLSHHAQLVKCRWESTKNIERSVFSSLTHVPFFPVK